MLFRSPSSPVSLIISLFDNFTIGECLEIGTDASFWVGSFGGIQDGVALLTNARLFANAGKPIDGISPLVRIPIKFITFVSPKDNNNCSSGSSSGSDSDSGSSSGSGSGSVKSKKGLKKLKFW